MLETVESDHGYIAMYPVDDSHIQWLSLSSVQDPHNLLDLREASESLLLRTGAWNGPIAVSAELVDSEPPSPSSEWEETVQITCQTNAGLAVGEFMGEPDIVIITAEPGSYGIRFEVNGRQRSALENRKDPHLDDDGGLIFNSEPFEFWKITVWPG